MKTKIIMDSGKEYIHDGSIHDMEEVCMNINQTPMGGRIEILKNGFVNITSDVVINPSHISSLEEIDD